MIKKGYVIISGYTDAMHDGSSHFVGLKYEMPSIISRCKINFFFNSKSIQLVYWMQNTIGMFNGIFRCTAHFHWITINNDIQLTIVTFIQPIMYEGWRIVKAFQDLENNWPNKRYIQIIILNQCFDSCKIYTN